MAESPPQWRDNRPCDRLSPRYRRRFYLSAVAVFAPTFLLSFLFDAARGFPLWKFALDIVLLEATALFVVAALPIWESRKATDLLFGENFLLWRARDAKVRRAAYDDVLMIRTSRYRADWVDGNCERFDVSLRAPTSWRTITLWLTPPNRSRLESTMSAFRQARRSFGAVREAPAQQTAVAESIGGDDVDGWIDNRPCDRMPPGSRRMVILVMAVFFVASVSIQFALGIWLYRPPSSGMAVAATLIGVSLFVVFLPFIAESRMAVAVRPGSNEIAWRIRSGRVLRLSYERFLRIEPSGWKGDWSEGVCQRYVAVFRSRFPGGSSGVWLTPLNKARLEVAIRLARGSL